MKTIEDHIEKDQKIVDDPTTSPAARRHYKEESVSYTQLRAQETRQYIV